MLFSFSLLVPIAPVCGGEISRILLGPLGWNNIPELERNIQILIDQAGSTRKAIGEKLAAVRYCEEELENLLQDEQESYKRPYIESMHKHFENSVCADKAAETNLKLLIQDKSTISQVSDEVAREQYIKLANEHSKSLHSCESGINTAYHEAQGVLNNAKEAIRSREIIAQQVNSIIWILAQVRTHKDAQSLLEAKRLLTEKGLIYENIHDENLIKAINGICDTIAKIEIEKGQEDINQLVFDEAVTNCMLDSISEVGVGNAINPVGALANLATSAVGSYASYRRKIGELQTQMKIKNWELEKARIEELSEKDREMNKILFELSEKYHYPDAWRITSDEAIALAEILKWDDQEKMYRKLTDGQTESRYKKFSQYWLQRGLLALALSKKAQEKRYPEYSARLRQEAVNSLNCYLDSADAELNRRSPDMVLAATAMAGITLQEFSEKWGTCQDGIPEWKLSEAGKAAYESRNAKLERYIEMIQKNSDETMLQNTWKDRIVICMLEREIGREKDAMSHLENLKEELRQQADLKEPINIKSGDITVAYSPVHAESLSICLNELDKWLSEQKAPDQSLQDIIGEKHISSLRKFDAIGKQTREQQKEMVRKELDGIELRFDDHWFTKDCVTLQMPISWFYTGNPEVALYVQDKQENLKLLQNNPPKTLEEKEVIGDKCIREVVEEGNSKYMLIHFFYDNVDDYLRENKLIFRICTNNAQVELIFRGEDSRKPEACWYGNGKQRTWLRLDMNK